MFFVPVDGVFDADGVGSGVEGDGLDEVRVLPGAGDRDRLADVAGAGLDRVDLVNRRHGSFERAGVDVPRVVLLRCINEGLELISTGVRAEVLGVSRDRGERRDTSGLSIDRHFDLVV